MSVGLPTGARRPRISVERPCDWPTEALRHRPHSGGQAADGNPEGTDLIVYNVKSTISASFPAGSVWRSRARPLPHRHRGYSAALRNTLPHVPEPLEGCSPWRSGTPGEPPSSARDPFGIKPLFLREHRGALWFASEIKACSRFQEHPGSRPGGSFPIPGLQLRTREPHPLPGITELEPGTLLEYRPGGGRFPDEGSSTWITHRPRMDLNTAVEESRRLLGRRWTGSW
jgi:hypothetical protein